MFDEIKNKVKELLIKNGERWLFPDFSNKITWSICTLGMTVILTPIPFKVVLYNWLIDTLKLNSGQHFTIAELIPERVDYWLGFLLIFAALTHNILCKFLANQTTNKDAQYAADERDVDRILFSKFLLDFPSQSGSIRLLQDHDFGNSFRLESLAEFNRFLERWGHAETTFLNSEINLLKENLYVISKEFSCLLCIKSGPTSVGRQSVVPDQHRDDWNWPKEVTNDVSVVNELASKVADAHQEFILKSKQLLRC
jgi:hypothetical protein